MSVLTRFADLPPQRRALLVRALLTVSLYRAALSTLPFRVVRSLAARRVKPSRRALTRAKRPEELTWAVAAASRRVPRASCLTQALALQEMLARAGLASDLHIGVAKSEDGRFEAHAWLEREGRVVIGGRVERFTRLARVASLVP